MVDHGRPQRHTDRLGVGGRQPSRQHSVRTYSRVCGRSGSVVRRRDLAPRPLHLDRGYNSRVHRLCNSPAITDVICAKRRPRDQTNHIKLPTPLGIRWTVERTNPWLTNYGQLRRNTDRPTPTRGRSNRPPMLLLSGKWFPPRSDGLRWYRVADCWSGCSLRYPTNQYHSRKVLGNPRLALRSNAKTPGQRTAGQPLSPFLEHSPGFGITAWYVTLIRWRP